MGPGVPIWQPASTFMPMQGYALIQPPNAPPQIAFVPGPDQVSPLTIFNPLKAAELK
jgi:hypothetical protein